MARRRRRIATEINIKHSSLFAFILLNLLITSVATYHQHNQQHQYQHHQYQQHHHHHHNHHQTSANYNQRHDLFADQPDYDNPKPLKPHYTASSQQQQVPSTAAHLCSFLPQQLAKHVKLCKLIAHSPSADEAVTLGASRGLAECRNQFKSDRWNCTHSHGDHHLLTGELTQSIGNRESGFLHAIAAAGIVHSIATACSVGNLTDCTCDKTRFGFGHRSDELGTAWKWGGCSNNIRHGMSFAKHLVELLDAVHMHSLSLRHINKAGSHHLVSRNLIDPSHRIVKRSLSSKSRDPNQVRARLLTGAITPADRFELAAALVQPQAPPSYCQRNHNISQAAHLELIKSLLSKNSLERHQEIRLAMNMHNNKVGRMFISPKAAMRSKLPEDEIIIYNTQAVAKNMEFRCRCHGLSGTCSLKTCWLTLPDFQVIGDYLRKKYEASVHLPTVVNVNKLIPMMDRNELSAILSGSQQVGPQQQQQQQQQPPPPLGYSILIQTTATTPTTTTPSSSMTSTTNSPPIDHVQDQVDQVVLASASKLSRGESQLTDMEPLMADAPSPARMQLSGHFIPVTPVGPSSTQSPTHYNFYYERHKQLQQVGQFSPSPSITTGTGDKLNLRELNSGGDMMHDLKNIAPMSQQQYQALLRDMKLCNNITTTTTTTSHLTTRDLSHHQPEGHQMSGNQDEQTGKQQQLQKKLISQQQSAPPSPPPLASQQHLIKSANQQLSQLLHSNKDDLVHLHKSPDYCEADLKHGFPGVQSRVCSDDPLAPDNCDKLCCGRGFTTRVYQHSYKCDSTSSSSFSKSKAT